MMIVSYVHFHLRYFLLYRVLRYSSYRGSTQLYPRYMAQILIVLYRQWRIMSDDHFAVWKYIVFRWETERYYIMIHKEREYHHDQKRVGRIPHNHV